MSLSKILVFSHSVSGRLNETGQVVYEWNDQGPVYGPNGEFELDPGNNLCGAYIIPIFSSCKNNCPGGELLQTPADNLN